MIYQWIAIQVERQHNRPLVVGHVRVLLFQICKLLLHELVIRGYFPPSFRSTGFGYIYTISLGTDIKDK